uniref:CCHC-type domain-containing protein n=1 Tax=Cajanus cajan TaxID=3821 RepID=A0A151S1Y3_CAJCA|nr:hypothetical protein KK1_029566 [Cajanus cajan]
MKERMAEVWHPRRGVSIKEVEKGLFLFQFFHRLDIQIPLYTVPFWLQLHNLPTDFMTPMVGQKLGDYIGSFQEYDEKNSSNGSFLEYLKGGDSQDILFKYERLGPFCFYCGLMGHLDDDCEQLFITLHDDDHRKWGIEIRADPRSNPTSSQWLHPKNMHGDSTHPYNQGSSVIRGNCNSSNQIKNIHSSSTKESHQRTELMSQIFKNPKCLFPSSSLPLQADAISGSATMEEDSNDHTLIVGDRKRRHNDERQTNLTMHNLGKEDHIHIEEEYPDFSNHFLMP